MTKYRCLDCGHEFGGDLSTMQCPNCGSTQIKEKSRTGAIPWKKVVIAGVILGVVWLVISFLAGGDNKLEAELSDKNGTITINVDGISASSLSKEYQVVIFDDQNNRHNVLAFDQNKSAHYAVRNLLQGQCYTFQVARKDNKSFDIRWETSNIYCVPVPPISPVIDRIEPGVADHNKLVWNGIKIVMKEQGDFTYKLDDIAQSQPIFNNIKPGNHIVEVANAAGVSVTQPLYLSDIKQLSPPLTLQQVQNIFNQVSSGNLSATDAQAKLAVGNVDLSVTIWPDIKTLWGALMEAEMGAQFNVVSFDNDPTTNKIKSGTLKISRK